MKSNSAVTFIEVLISLALISILMAIIVQPRMSAMYSGYGMGGYYGMGNYGLGYYPPPWRREVDVVAPTTTNSSVSSVWSGYAYAPPSYLPPAFGAMVPGGYMAGMGMGVPGMIGVPGANPYDPFGPNAYGMYGSWPPGWGSYRMPPPYYGYYGMPPMGMPTVPIMGMTVAQAPADRQGINVTNWIITTNWVVGTNSNK